jgi:hypothetical protein
MAHHAPLETTIQKWRGVGMESTTHGEISAPGADGSCCGNKRLIDDEHLAPAMRKFQKFTINSAKAMVQPGSHSNQPMPKAA